MASHPHNEEWPMGPHGGRMTAKKKRRKGGQKDNQNANTRVAVAIKLEKRIKIFIKKFLTQKRIPIWLTLIIIIAGWVVPGYFVYYLESKQTQESAKHDLVIEVMKWSNEINRTAKSITQFRLDLENWDMALSSGLPVEVVNSLGKRAIDSQEVLLESVEAFVKQELIISSRASELKQMGFDLTEVLKERSPTLDQVDIAINIEMYKVMSPNQRARFAVEYHEVLLQIMASLMGVEETTYKLDEAIYELFTSLK